jgi:hypothetical protein
MLWAIILIALAFWAGRKYEEKRERKRWLKEHLGPGAGLDYPSRR